MKLHTVLGLLVIAVCMNLMAAAQVINGYAEVTSISGTTFQIGNIDESGDSFEDGDYVIIMQMQDDVIGATGNNASFGDLGGIESAGLYEVRQIASHTESGTSVTSITVSGALGNTYNTGNTSSVQLITFPVLGNPHHTTTGNYIARDWDGSIGGVLALDVHGTLTLAHSLSANETGFRGGDRDTHSSGSCDANLYKSPTTNKSANKGESIFKVQAASMVSGRGKILNGGGAGNEHNAGGGGGGGYTAGGQGGPGWNCGTNAGGLGGIELGPYVSESRIFMGGGGGGGEGNNSVSTNGGDGGGIILIRADEIATASTCAGVSLSANGGSVGDAGNDGGGGGGAGGTILIETDAWNIHVDCFITVESNGGDGGTVGHWASHGGGGGGGQGTVIYSIAEPTMNTTTTTNNGNGGCNNNTCSSVAASGAGFNGIGILQGLSGPLPVELISFDAREDGAAMKAIIEWITASEMNNDYFIVEHSTNGLDWEDAIFQDGAGNSSSVLKYEVVHDEPVKGANYYKLRQVDFDGTESYSQIRLVQIKGSTEPVLEIFPNPSTDRMVRVVLREGEIQRIRIVNGMGAIMLDQRAYESNEEELNCQGMAKGTYVVLVETSVGKMTKKLILR